MIYHGHHLLVSMIAVKLRRHGLPMMTYFSKGNSNCQIGSGLHSELFLLIRNGISSRPFPLYNAESEHNP